jgi:DNA-directed RNA polymerase specialized sigma24 family protein
MQRQRYDSAGRRNDVMCGHETHSKSDGDDSRFLAIIANTRERASAYIRCVTRDADERSDILADVVALCWTDRRCLLDAVDPGALVLGHVRNVCRVWKNNRRHDVIVGADAVLDASSEACEDESMSVRTAQARIAWAERILSTLTPQQRVAVDFRCRWGWPYEIIAHVLDASEATARVHVWRGLRNLQRVAANDLSPRIRRRSS